MKTFVQIGAHTGKDYFQNIILKLTDPANVILVEPNSELINILEQNYSFLTHKHKINICNKAISINNGTADLHLYHSSTGHSSLISRKSHHPSHFINVETITFKKLCEIYSIKEVEFLFIDTEGLDYEIINSIDFSSIKINSLCFEVWPYDNDDSKNNFKTGTSFFNNIIKPKLEKYFILKEQVKEDVSNLLYIRK